MKRTLAVLTGAALLLPGATRGAEQEAPRLELRTARRVAFSPVEAFFVAELRGGDEVEEFYCPELVWEWGDGSRSIRQSDCPPFDPDGELRRFYTARHVYRWAGNHQVRLTLRKADRAIASASVSLSVHSRFGN